MNIKQKIFSLSSHKKELLKGSYQTIGLKILGMLIGYIFIAFISRNYGAEAVGIYQISIQLMTIVATLSLFGFNQSIIRFTADWLKKDQINEVKLLLKFFALVSFTFSLVLSLLVYVYATNLSLLLFKSSEYTLIFQIVSFLIPVLTLNNLFIEFIRGLNKIKTSEFLRLFSIKFINLLAFLSMLYFIEYNNYLPVISFEIGLLLTFLLTIYFVAKYTNELESTILHQKRINKKELMNTSFTMYQSILFSMLSSQLLIFLLAYLSTPSEVGIYNIAYQLASLTIFVFGAIITAVGPKFAELYWNDKSEFDKVIKFSSKLIFWITGSISIFTIVFSSQLLSLFGEEFIVGSSILVILSISNLFNAMTGPGGILLDMVGKHHIRRNSLLIATIIALSIAPFLIEQYSGIGLAIVLLVHNFIGNTITVIYLYKKMDINLIYIPFWSK